MHRNKFTENYNFEVYKSGKGGYSISLPHQCGEWEILGAEVDEDDDTEPNDGGYPALPLNKKLAIKQMELFIQRAQEALQKLRELN